MAMRGFQVLREGKYLGVVHLDRDCSAIRMALHRAEVINAAYKRQYSFQLRYVTPEIVELDFEAVQNAYGYQFCRPAQEGKYHRLCRICG